MAEQNSDHETFPSSLNESKLEESAGKKKSRQFVWNGKNYCKTRYYELRREENDRLKRLQAERYKKVFCTITLQLSQGKY